MKPYDVIEELKDDSNQSGEFYMSGHGLAFQHDTTFNPIYFTHEEILNRARFYERKARFLRVAAKRFEELCKDTEVTARKGE